MFFKLNACVLVQKTKNNIEIHFYNFILFYRVLSKLQHAF